MNILVCGAGGFIGGHLVWELLDRGHTVRAVDIKPLDTWFQQHQQADNLMLDLRDTARCRQAAEGMIRVFNLAADMGGMGYIEANKARCMLSVLINTNLLLAAKHHLIYRFFFSSSACVYNARFQSNPKAIALREEEAYPAMPEDGYGWEKLFSERMCRHFTEDFGLDTRVARFHNVYGPLGSFDGGREKAPAAICRKVIEAKLSGKHEIEIWGTGEQTRSFMWIGDCIDGVLKIMDSHFSMPINLGSNELVSINQLVDMVEGIAGIKLKRIYKLDAPIGVNGRNSDNTLIKSLFGWEPSTRLKVGMEATYRWIYDQLKK